jgi:hypothetical protein
MRKEKTGGRKKGTPNRHTSEIKEAIKNIIDNKLNDVINDFDLLQPQQRIKFFIDLLPYVIPKEKDLPSTTPNTFNIIDLGNGTPPKGYDFLPRPIEIKVIRSEGAPPLANDEKDIVE